MNPTTKTMDERLSLRTKIGYGLGDFGSQFAYSMASLFLFYFLTDVALIGASVAGMIMMISRGWEAFTDPVMGYITDHTRSRWGRKRPYLLFGAVPMGLSIALLYMTPDLSGQWKFLYYLVISLFMWTMFTVVFIPYQSLLPAITRNFHERSQLAGIAKLLTIIALIVIGGVTKPFVTSPVFGSESGGFTVMGVIYGAICVIAVLIAFASTKENVTEPGDKRYGMREIAPLVFKNIPFLIASLTGFMVFLVFSITGATLNYYFKYVLKNEAFVAVAFSCVFAISAVVMPLWIAISKKVGKKRVYMVSLAMYAGMFAALFFIHVLDPFLLVPLFILGGVGFAGINFGFMAIMPDTVEYGQWKLGNRVEGVLYGVNNFIMKLSVSLAGLIVGLALDSAGYIANVAQGDSSLYVIRIFTSIVPAGLLLFAMALLAFYPIDEEMHTRMCREIDGR